ncbi:Toll-interacting protein [Paragonimus heterotremus]|uniref:Toll-interacting protein n=1 Tax=Paragonimus heterotremus TaxID=100268 RepID=A0A8J4WY27_9TREM|nr:Toll-interacting protein [Paragonimus heterotremus]
MTSVTVSAESEVDSSLSEKRKQCLLCPLPNDFLRVLPYNEDLYARGAVHREDRFLELAIIEARLAKNYGFTSMSPYCRVRLGDARYETQTALSSSKHPSWNELCRLPMSGDNTLLSVVLMNEGMLLSDSKIAWTTIPLPRNLFDGETVDMWYELSGKQGQGLEGTIHLSMRIRTVLRLVPNYRSSTVGRTPPIRTGPLTQQSTEPPSVVPPVPSRPIVAEDVQAIKEVFPSIADDTIQTLLESHDGNRDEVTSELLRMTTET